MVNPPGPGRAFWLVLLLAAALRLGGLGEKQLWVDELIQADHTAGGTVARVLRELRVDVAPCPLDYLAQHLSFGLFGRSEVAARLPAALAGIAAVAAIYGLGAALLGRRAALTAALLLAVYPLHLQYSQEGRPYSLFVLFTLLSWLALAKAMRGGGLRRWAGYGLAVLALLYTHYHAWLVLAVQAVFVAAAPAGPADAQPEPTRSPGRWWWFGASAGVALALFLPWAWLTWDRTRGTAAEALDWGRSRRVRKEWGAGSYPLAGLLLGLAGLGAWRLWRSGQRGLLAVLLAWFPLSVGPVLLAAWWRDYFFAIRTVLFTTPALLLLSAEGAAALGEAAWLPGRRRRLAPGLAMGAAVAISLVVTGAHFRYRGEDWRGAGQFLAREVRAGDAVAAPGVEGLLRYYFPEIDQHAVALASLPESAAGRVLIVQTRFMPIADRARLDALAARWSTGPLAEFEGIRVTALELRPRSVPATKSTGPTSP